MLRQYGPDVPDSVLRKLVAAFAELRGMADDGLISYPYSTREVTNMVRHLQVQPECGGMRVCACVYMWYVCVCACVRVFVRLVLSDASIGV